MTSRKRLTCITFVAWAILVPAPHVYAEPGTAAKELMRDSVSMLDWGIFKLERSLDDYELKIIGKTKKGDLTVPADIVNHVRLVIFYEWDTNTIVISGNFASNMWCLRKLPRQGDSSKVEFSAVCRASIGVMSFNAS